VNNLLEKLNEEQKKAVTAENEPLLIVAGAGTGKTRVITYRIAYLIQEKKIPPNEILTLTFTEKAANELQERIDQLVPYGFNDVCVETFHSLGYKIIKDNSYFLGLPPSFQLLTQADQIVFITDNIDKFPLEKLSSPGNPLKYVDGLIKVFSRIKDENISIQEYQNYLNEFKNKIEQIKKIESNNDEFKKLEDEYIIQKEICNAYIKYEELKLKQSYIDYGDLITLPLKLFNNNKNILEKYQQKFKYILVDEFQDTNYAQFLLLHILIEKSQNITVVADDDQSIFKFRGACLSNVLQFKKIYKNTKQIVLTKNYRSNQIILDAAYRLIQNNNPDRLEVTNNINKKLISQKEGETPQLPVVHLYFDTNQTEADTVAKIIKKFIDEKKYKYKNFAILVRRNSDAEEFIKSLIYYGIPWNFSGNKGLYDTLEIKLLLCFLRVISNPNDSISLHYLATSEIYKCSPYELAKINSETRYYNRILYDIFKDIINGDTSKYIPKDQLKLEFKTDPFDISESTKQKLSKLISDMDKYIELSQQISTAELLYKFLHEKGILKQLTEIKDINSVRKANNIAKFYRIIDRISQLTKYNRVIEFVDYISKLIDAGDDPEQSFPEIDTDEVKILTIHKAKGLEFEVVFMVSLVEDRFPSTDRHEQLELPAELIKEIPVSGDFHIEEERRLFYVGMTRAKDILYLTHSRDYGGKRTKKVSRFVQEALDIIVDPEKYISSSSEDIINRYKTQTLLDKKGLETILKNDILSLSAYAIDDYLTCPLKYKYVHILRIPLLKHHAVVFGSVIHDVLREYNLAKKENRKFTLNDLLDIYEKLWQSTGFLTREHEEKRKQQGKQALINYYNLSEQLNIIPYEIEQEFSFILNETIQQVRITGRIDRIDKRNSEFVIVDFKTGSTCETKEKANIETKKSKQLSIYSLAFKNRFNRLPDKLELHFIEKNIIGEIKPDLNTIEKIIQNINKVIDGINKLNFEPNPNVFSCMWCAYSNICPSRINSV